MFDLFKKKVNLNKVNTCDLEIIGKSFQSTVWALSVETAVKAFSKPEVNALKWANKINKLCVKFIDSSNSLLAMERVYPVALSSLNKATVDKFISIAEVQLEELWASGFAHCDLRRPDCARRGGWGEPAILPEEVLYNNIIFTKDGIRLIDFNMSLTKDTVKNLDYDIEFYINKDKKDWQKFKAFVYNSL